MLFHHGRFYFRSFVILALALTGLWVLLAHWLSTPTGATRTVYRELGFRGGIASTEAAQSIDLDFTRTAHAPRRYFSVRWSTVWFVEQPGTYDLTLGGDDAGAMRVDGNVVLTRNGTVGFEPESAARELTAGPHTLEIDYEQAGGLAFLLAAWAPGGGRPRPFAQALLFTQAPTPTQVRINAWLAWLRCGIVAVWLVVVCLAAVRFRDAIRAAWPWLARVAAVFIVVAAAAIRFDAISVMYGPFERPSWLYELEEHTRDPVERIRPASFAFGRVEQPYVGGDPANYLGFAREMTSFYAAHVREPIHPFTTKLWLWLLANQDVAVSFASATFSVLAVAATYLLGSFAFSRGVGLFAAFALAMERDVIELAAEGWRDDATMAVFVLACYAFLRCLNKPTTMNAILAGVIGGAALLTRITTLSFLLPAIALLAWRGLPPMADVPSRAAYWRTAAISLGVMTLIAAPYLINCAIVYGDPLYAINYHTSFYRARAGLPFEQPMSVSAYFAMRLRHHPWDMVMTGLRGLITYPFEIKWVGFVFWRHGLGRPLMWLSLLGMAWSLWTRNGRVLAILLIASLLPYAFTWSIPGGGEWRFTIHAYPIYLIAMAFAIQRLATAATAWSARHVHRLRGEAGRLAVR